MHKSLKGRNESCYKLAVFETCRNIDTQRNILLLRMSKAVIIAKSIRSKTHSEL